MILLGILGLSRAALIASACGNLVVSCGAMRLSAVSMGLRRKREQVAEQQASGRMLDNIMDVSATPSGLFPDGDMDEPSAAMLKPYQQKQNPDAAEPNDDDAARAAATESEKKLTAEELLLKLASEG